MTVNFEKSKRIKIIWSIEKTISPYLFEYIIKFMK